MKFILTNRLWLDLLRFQVFTFLSYPVFVDTKNLNERETWTIDRNDERGGTTTLVNIILLQIHNVEQLT